MGIEDDFLKGLGMDKDDKDDKWAEVIRPAQSYLIIGDVGTGKSGLAYWLLERFSRAYNLLPATVGFPRDKQALLPDNFVCPETGDVANLENSVICVDEAGLQLPIEDTKKRQVVINFLSLPRHRNQILILSFHFPRLVLARYLPYFSGFLIKRPPYLLEFSGKRQGDELTIMMGKAEERFAELDADDVVKHTYVIAPRIRWQGLLSNPLASFWSDELSKAWAGEQVEQVSAKQPDLFAPQKFQVQGKGWHAEDPEQKLQYPVTPAMQRGAIEVERHEYQNSTAIILEHPPTRIRWVDFRR